MARFGKTRVVIIGGNAAGMTAASRLLRLDPDAEVIVLEKSQYISYSICGAPYYLEGLIPGVEDLLAFTPETARMERRISARTEWECSELLPGRREVICRHLRSGMSDRLHFDNLVLATGYRPAVGSIAGADHAKVFKISQLENIVDLKHFVDARRPRKAVVVGGGYIGLNVAEALVKRGLSVQLLDRGDQILHAFDADIASLVEAECRNNGLEISKFAPVNEILFDGDQPAGVVAANQTYRAELVVVDVGIVPEVQLAQQAGLRIGSSGAVAVSPRMETSQDGIYAAGNCAEAIHLVTGRPVVSGLGTHAAKQGRVAGENIAGIRSEFAGVLQTSITKFFSLSVARTGLNEWEASSFGFPFGAVSVTTPSRAGYFPPKERLTVKMIFDKKTQRLLGAQIAGPPWTTKRIDVAATAITAGLTLEQIAQLDLAYSPPHAPLWDPLLVAANVALRQLR